MLDLVFWISLAATLQTVSQQAAIVVVGAPGTDEYAREFAGWAEQWKSVSARAPARLHLVGMGPETEVTDREQLAKHLGLETAIDADTLWIVLIGHGTFDGEMAKFNLRGPDVSADELSQWLASCRRPTVIVNCASSSGFPFLNQLAGSGRVVVTATKSGFQYNFARFGKFFTQAIGDPQADLDKDRQTSVLEAFLLASSQVGEFYESNGRLATEHALIDDNGDGRGTPASWFRGVRVTRQAQEGEADGLRANQFVLIRSSAEQQLSPEDRRRRDELEAELEQLRPRKPHLDEADYYEQLEGILVQLARIYEG